MKEDYLGQLFVLGFTGKDFSQEFEGFFSRNRIGGVILLGENFDTLANLKKVTTHIRSLSEIPPFVMIDQEVQGVNRIEENMPILSDDDLSDSANLTLRVQKVFSETATILRDTGINVQLAPVVDLPGGATNHVLKHRCFGGEPNRVAELGTLATHAIQSRGISACAKHFPGLGRAREDPHLRLARVETSKGEWLKTDAVPFRGAISEGVRFVMSTHMICSSLDDTFPATLSRKVIDGCLKRELGFEGLIITDDLTMRGIGENHSIPEVAVKALAAGHHLLLICKDFETQKETLEFVRKAYLNRELSRERVDQAVLKILDFKRRYVRPQEIAQ